MNLVALNGVNWEFPSFSVVWFRWWGKRLVLNQCAGMKWITNEVGIFGPSFSSSFVTGDLRSLRHSDWILNGITITMQWISTWFCVSNLVDLHLLNCWIFKLGIPVVRSRTRCQSTGKESGTFNCIQLIFTFQNPKFWQILTLKAKFGLRKHQMLTKLIKFELVTEMLSLKTSKLAK